MSATTMNFATRYNPETKTWMGPLDPPNLAKVKFESCGEKILRGLSENPDKIGQVCLDNGVSITRNELRLQSIRVAQHLQGFGYREFDIVMIISRNNHKVAPIIYGSLMAGLQVTPLDVEFDIDEIDHIIKLTKPKMIVLEYDILRTVEHILKKNNFSIPLFIFDKSVFNYKHVDCLLQKTGRENSFKLVDVSNPVTSVAFIIWSSGTTGPNKGIRLSHAHFSNIPYDFDETTFYTGSSVHWIFGVYSVLVVAFHQAVHVVTAKKFSPELLSNLSKNHNLTFLLLRPDYISMLVASPILQQINFSTVTYIASSGPLSHDDKTNFEKCLPNGMVGDGYTFTEFGNLVAKTFTYRKGSVGFLTKSVQVRIYNDDNELCGPNETGELHVRPNLKFLGYINNESATRNVLDANGWIKSGDLSYFDEDGYLYIVGKRNYVLVHSGKQMNLSEIEEILKTLEQIEEVAVIELAKLPNESFLVACIIKKPGSILNENDVNEFLEGKVEDYQKLRGGVYFLNELPKTVSGNIKKRMLAEKISKKLSEAKR